MFYHIKKQNEKKSHITQEMHKKHLIEFIFINDVFKSFLAK